MKLNPLRLILVAFILFTYHIAYPATYYFSATNGNDSYSSIQARNPLTPWKSIDKLNSYFKYLNSGDSVLFKRSEKFFGSIIVSKSGAVFAPIYIGAYGKGDKPEINTLATLKNWKQVKTGVYESDCSTEGITLILNGIQQRIGRYPNAGYLSYESHVNNSSITDDQLTASTNWVGAELVVRKNRWIIDRSTITGQTEGSITYAPGNNAVPTNGYGYFIQKDIKTLDQFGEWYFDATRHKMMVFFGAYNPNRYQVQTSFANNLVTIKNYHYITFDNISFVGAGSCAISLIQCRKITLSNCNIDLTGAEAVLASYSPFLNISNCTINHSLSGGINLDVGCTNASVLKNLIKNTGLIPGLGKSGSGTYEGITAFGDNTMIEKNIIDSTGYNGIYFGGNTSVAKNNYITYFCLTKDDGAGIYVGDWSKTVNKKILGNIILHGIGNNAGAGKTKSMQAEGIYIDDNTESVTISDNTVSLCADNGIKIHNAKDINIYNNIAFNNGVQLRLEQDHYLTTSSYIRNNNIVNNTFFSGTSQQATAKFSTHQDDMNSFGQLDSNFYNRPKNEISNTTAPRLKNGINTIYNLPNWKTINGKDQFSVELATDSIRFEYNATDQIKTIALNQNYQDIHRNTYVKQVNIKPYSSVILIATVAKPKYASSSFTTTNQHY
ncbi:right-handed parallel beta-helix repeat-containing protein [Mucilaginibacter paludis]|uniref:Parallel beta-helix repeat containing protein n=1 Tax=Mucilaginibacter paludis DSM 18603 TaxID=714943 RepID=H1Y8U8_9SPHI|nr:right-handed parallel beta-helix repeat-containing protein [Mucilaginibacter paludis]EHQ28714.1 parallel beta-helix repeat containing protein [Mucilaginibacter paludis DSM 18603]